MFWTWNTIAHIVVLQAALAFYVLAWPVLRKGLAWSLPKLGQLLPGAAFDEQIEAGQSKKPYRGKWRDTEYHRAEPSDKTEWQKRRQRRTSATQHNVALKTKHLRALGLREPVHLLDIKSAYRQLAKEYHPDRFASGQHDERTRLAAAARMREVNAAYDWLRSNA